MKKKGVKPELKVITKDDHFVYCPNGETEGPYSPKTPNIKDLIG